MLRLTALLLAHHFKIDGLGNTMFMTLGLMRLKMTIQKFGGALKRHGLCTEMIWEHFSVLWRFA